MKEKQTKRIFTFIIFTFYAATLFAEKITFSSDRMSGRANSKNTATVLSGNATVQSGDIKITSDVIELSGKDFTNIKASGSVTGENTKDQFSFSADLLKYDRTKKISEFFGNVKFVDTKNDAIVKGDYALYNEANEILIIKFNVLITQKDKTCKSIFANYNRKTSTIELVGKPTVTNKDDTFSAARITINLDTEDIKLQGKVSGKITED